MLYLKKRARSRLLESFILLGLLAVTIHTGINILTVDGQAFGVFSPGVTGQVSLEDSLDNIRLKYQSLTMGSRIILFLEWALLVALVILAIVKRGVISKKEEIHINLSRYGIPGQSGSNTEIDQLYKALKDKRALSIPTIAKAFKVNEETVMDWGKILETGNLAEIHYPWMGDPQIKIVDLEAEAREKLAKEKNKLKNHSEKDGEKEKDAKDNGEKAGQKEKQKFAEKADSSSKKADKNSAKERNTKQSFAKKHKANRNRQANKSR